MVWGEADEDGFIEGELLDGRKGMIPMNFCEKLTGDDLLEFHQSVVLGFTSEEEVRCALCSRNFQNVKLRPKNEFLFKCGNRIFQQLRFYVKSILAEFESQNQPF